MNPLAHNEVAGVELSCKTRILQRGGQIGIAGNTGLLFLQMERGVGTATVLKLLDEKYLKGKEVTDFIEYKRD